MTKVEIFSFGRVLNLFLSFQCFGSSLVLCMDMQGLLWTHYAFKEFCKLFPHYALANFLKNWFNTEIQALLDSSVEVYRLNYVALVIS